MRAEYLIIMVITLTAATNRLYAQALPTMERKIYVEATYGINISNVGITNARSIGQTFSYGSLLYDTRRNEIYSEFRATSPLVSSIAKEKNAMGGIKYEHAIYFARPYAEFMFGQAQLTYLSGGLRKSNSSIIYTNSRSNVYEVSCGVAININKHISFIYEQGFEKLSIPVLTNPHTMAFPISFGVMYHMIQKGARENER